MAKSKLNRLAPKRVRRAVRRVLPDPRGRLLRKMPKGSVCAEIGVWQGNFSESILRVVKPRELHLIDPWRFESDPQYAKAFYGGLAAASQEEMDAVFERVAGRFSGPRSEGRVQIHRCSSLAASSRFDDEYFDWVYVDGNHLYEFVLSDLESFFPKVRPGGYLAGDDYGSAAWYEGGVTRAVHDFCGSEDAAQLLSTRGRQFVIQKL